MASPPRKFDRDFKLQAVRLVTEQGRTIASVARELGIRDTVVGRWVQLYRADEAEAFPGHGNLKPTDEAFRKLERRNAQLEDELKILKKAVAIFSKDPK